ncbi:Acetyltransferase [Frankia canadensis]|uniref:Acetyltransferase n=1 Tax=Frankia canadensis TaxID=1836972 RepID=A0A2I2KXI0_9ACTN|nr:N-acetyltransferase [Frankia canadensis]SNQ50370.1 Acetyltransferase [Frankia canadensis]SOU57660.1 Acetyltransferase [Frankia canadensis]
MQIRHEQPGDREAVRDVIQRAFGDKGATVADLVDSLRETLTAHGGLSLVAERDGQVVGHAMTTRSLLDAPRRLVDVQVLSPLSVVPEQQRNGIGSALVRRGLALLAQSPAPLVFLQGDPAYYARFGFTPGADHDFRKPSLRVPDAAFQVFLLPAYQLWMTGTLVYADAFWRYDAVGLRDPDA